MRIEPELSETSVVLLGNLNPRIFTPDWFVRNELLRPKDIETAEIEIVHSQVTKFRIDWFQLEVQTERFWVTTSQIPVQLRDLVVRTFKEFLPHTPLRQLGINRNVHFKVDSFETRTRIGQTLAPPEAWGKWAPMIKGGEHNKRSGMISIVMQQHMEDDRPKGYTRTTVQPSTKVGGELGIYVQVNDHFEVEAPEKVVGSEEVIDLLEMRFEKSVSRSEWIIDQVMSM